MKPRTFSLKQKLPFGIYQGEPLQVAIDSGVEGLNYINRLLKMDANVRLDEEATAYLADVNRQYEDYQRELENEKPRKRIFEEPVETFLPQEEDSEEKIYADALLLNAEPTLHVYALNHTMPFGTHQGETIKDLIVEHTKYIKGLLETGEFALTPGARNLYFKIDASRTVCDPFRNLSAASLAAFWRFND
ncbi:MAG: hypothetical protein Q4D14_02560 [Bacteroidales bacterium]|nr:hypothetical protein [Bacteroidales bacterium]